MKCIKGMTIRPLKSWAGWYIGSTTFDMEAGCIVPKCQVSTDYYKTEELARKAMVNGFTQRTCCENQFCSGGKGCCLSKETQPQSIGGLMVKKMIENYEKGR